MQLTKMGPGGRFVSPLPISTQSQACDRVETKAKATKVMLALSAAEAAAVKSFLGSKEGATQISSTHPGLRLGTTE